MGIFSKNLISNSDRIPKQKLVYKVTYQYIFYQLVTLELISIRFAILKRFKFTFYFLNLPDGPL